MTKAYRVMMWHYLGIDPKDHKKKYKWIGQGFALPTRAKAERMAANIKNNPNVGISKVGEPTGKTKIEIIDTNKSKIPIMDVKPYPYKK